MKSITQQGFTLLEILIVVAIVATLGMVATGYYSDSVKKARCTEGRTAVLAAAAALEKCKAIYGSYNNAACNVAPFLGATPDGHFNVGVNNTATTFTLTATGLGVAAQANNPYCWEISVNNLGVQAGQGTNTW